LGLQEFSESKISKRLSILEGDNMADTGSVKSESGNLDAKEEQREEERHTTERNEEQELNQGMDTGTHDSTRRGVAWGPSYQVRRATGRKRQKKGEPTTTSNE
jgi:hypothetical protein